MEDRTTQEHVPTRGISRRAFVAGLGVLALTGCAGQGGGQAATTTAAATTAASTPASDDPYATGLHHATIQVENFGTIKVELNANVAPITVANFCKLVNEGFYNGLTFHRIIKDFMVQGGDPKGDGTGGSPDTIKGEFSSNGVKNPIPHNRGVISMARSSDKDSASSQFFIVHKKTESLDGEYAAFGHVTEGMEVVDKLAEVPVEDSNGTVAKENQPKITSITLDD